MEGLRTDNDVTHKAITSKNIITTAKLNVSKDILLSCNVIKINGGLQKEKQIKYKKWQGRKKAKETMDAAQLVNMAE